MEELTSFPKTESFHSTQSEDGTEVITGDYITVSIQPDLAPLFAKEKQKGSPNPVRFERVAHTFGLNTEPRSSIRWLVLQMSGGERLYITGSTIILTKRDLNP